MTDAASLSTAEWEELERLRRTFGEARFEAIRAATWEAHIASTAPSPDAPPLYPGLWRAVLDALRAAVRH
jgi:hypothetical protein